MKISNLLSLTSLFAITSNNWLINNETNIISALDQKRIIDGTTISPITDSQSYSVKSIDTPVESYINYSKNLFTVNESKISSNDIQGIQARIFFPWFMDGLSYQTLTGFRMDETATGPQIPDVTTYYTLRNNDVFFTMQSSETANHNFVNHFFFNNGSTVSPSTDLEESDVVVFRVSLDSFNSELNAKQLLTTGKFTYNFVTNNGFLDGKKVFNSDSGKLNNFGDVYMMQYRNTLGAKNEIIKFHPKVSIPVDNFFSSNESTYPVINIKDTDTNAYLYNAMYHVYKNKFDILLTYTQQISHSDDYTSFQYGNSYNYEVYDYSYSYSNFLKFNLSYYVDQSSIEKYILGSDPKNTLETLPFFLVVLAIEVVCTGLVIYFVLRKRKE